MTIETLLKQLDVPEVRNGFGKMHYNFELIKECIDMEKATDSDDLQTLRTILKSRWNKAVAYQRQCTKNAKTYGRNGDSKLELHWEQMKDSAWLKTEQLRDAIIFVENQILIENGALV